MCGFFGCKLNHYDGDIMKVIAMMGERVCIKDHKHVNPCGKTEYGDTCACGCDATGMRCE